MLKESPNAQGWVRCSDFDLLMRYRVFEGYVACVQADAAVWIAAGRAVFQVAVDGGEGVGQLAADLMMTAGV